MKPRDPILPGLFDQPTPSVVNQMRDQAMASVEVAAETRVPGFAERAEAFVRKHLASQGDTAGEQLTLACKAAGIVPHDDRAFGPVYMRLQRRGVIVVVGTVRRERGHGTAGGRVWRLLK